MATDPREVERITGNLRSGNFKHHAEEAANALERLASENAALREKLEAAEAELALVDKSPEYWHRRAKEAEAALTEARAAQAAAWEAGLSQPMPHDFIGVWHKVTEWCAENEETVEAQTAWGEVVRFLRSTPPADLSAALQRVRDEAWNDALEAGYQACLTCEGPLNNAGAAAMKIRALRRAPTEDR